MSNKLKSKIIKEDDWFVIECVEVPCVTQGRTKAHAIQRLKESVRLWLEVAVEDEPDIYERNGLDASLMGDLSFEVETEIRHKKSGDCQATHEDIMDELIVIKIRLSRLSNYEDEASEEVEEDRKRYKNLTALLERDEADLPTLGELGIEDAYY